MDLAVEKSFVIGGDHRLLRRCRSELWELTNKVLCAMSPGGVTQCVGSRDASKLGRDDHLFRMGGGFSFGHCAGQRSALLRATRRQLVGTGRFVLSRNGCRRPKPLSTAISLPIMHWHFVSDCAMTASRNSQATQKHVQRCPYQLRKPCFATSGLDC